MIKMGTTGLKELERFFRTAPEVATEAARMAINDTASRGGMRLIKDEMTKDVAFPAGYLTGDRLQVAKRATNSNLEAVILGRKRATSLARFVSGGAIVGSKRPGVSVRVKRGRTTYLKAAFLVRLKSGTSLSEDKYNVGLAVRIKPGETIKNKGTAHKAWLVPGRVALLYAPSVDQVFGAIIGDVVEPIGDMVASEFFRQFTRLSNGK